MLPLVETKRQAGAMPGGSLAVPDLRMYASKHLVKEGGHGWTSPSAGWRPGLGEPRYIRPMLPRNGRSAGIGEKVDCASLIDTPRE